MKANNKMLFGQTGPLNFLFLCDYVWHGPTEKKNGDKCTDTSKKQATSSKQMPWKTQCSSLRKEAQHGAFQLYNVLPLRHIFMPLILVLLAFKRQYLVFYINMPLKYKNVVSRQGLYTEIPRVTLSKVISHGNALAC